MSIEVKDREDLFLFLTEKGYEVEEREEGVFIIKDNLGLKNGIVGEEELTLKIVAAVTDEEIKFVVDLCRKDQIDPSKRLDFAEKVLDLNTDINPIAFAFDTIREGDERVVLVNSLPVADLDGSEVLLTLEKFASAALVGYEALREFLLGS